MNIIRDLNPFNYQWALILVIACCPLYNAFIFGLGVYLIVPIPFLLMFLYYLLVNGDKIPPLKDYVYIFMLMVLQVYILSSLMDDRDVIQDIKVLIIALLIMIHPTCKKTSRILYPVLTIVGVVVGYYMLKNQEYVNFTRLSLTVGEILQDPNWIAIFFFATFTYGFHLLTKGNFLLLGLGSLLMLFSTYIIFLTGSRGALLGLIVSFVFLIFINNKKQRLRNLVILLLVGIGFYFIWSFIISSSNADILERFTADDLGNDRISIWEKIIPAFLDGNILQILLGKGPGSCLRDIGMSGHNIFLEQIYQTGLAGIILLIIFIVKLLIDTYKCNNYIGFSVLLSLFTLSLTTPIWGHIYFMIPISATIYYNNSTRRKRNKNIMLRHSSKRRKQIA